MSYHSLEDKMVKQELAGRSRSSAPKGLPVELEEHKPTFRMITRGTHTPTAEEIEANPRIVVKTNAEIVGASGTDRLQHVTIRFNEKDQELTVPACGLFLLLGAHPCVDWLDGTVARDAKGFVLTGRDVPQEFWRDGLPPEALATSVPGVFAAGDIRAGSMKRVAAASGEGAGAVTLVHHWLEAVVPGTCDPDACAS